MLLSCKFKIKIPRWLLDMAIIFFIVSIIIISLYLIFEKIYQNKIYPNTFIGDINLSGLTKEQAKNIINNKINKINQTGITFYHDKTQAIISPTITSAEGDFAYQLINFDVEQTTNQAYAFGRGDNFFINLQNKIKALAYKRPINLLIAINEEGISKMLIKNFSQFEIPAENAKLIIDENYNSTVSEEKLGRIINYEKAINQLKDNLAQLNNPPIQLLTKTDYPQIYKKNCLNIDAKVKRILALAPLLLKHKQKQWKISKNKLANWLGLKINSQSNIQDQLRAKTMMQGEIIVGLNREVVENFLKNEVASDINKEPINAKFEIKNGRVVKFQASHDGIKLNTAASFAKIEHIILGAMERSEKSRNTTTKNPYSSVDETKSQTEIKLVVTELKSTVHTADVNDFGISEIIGTGQSSFAGSPSNRRHNIKIGAQALNGVLIKPNEEFSLNKALGKIDATTGYLPELVIKGNETIPEYGGGLCQIGTTMFRAALAAGLPITMRHNHSYRVSYYEPAGTDATIYDPWPDLRFINDTTHYILIQSRIEGDDLYFDFWGTKDGRIVEQTKPTIYNLTKPGPTKYIETLDLPVGEEKCTENAHNGADAYFDYKVSYANGEVKEKRFYSHYIPWQAICLIGVEKLSNNTTATSTEETIE